MKNRNNRHIENTIDEIAYHWNLSINEEEILNSFLNMLKDGDVNKLKQVEYLLNGEYKELFLSLSCAEKEELLNKLRDGTSL